MIQSQFEQVKKISDQREQEMERQTDQLQNDFIKIQDKYKNKQKKADEIIQRQTQNIQQLMKAASKFKDQIQEMKANEKQKVKLFDENSYVEQELAELKRYSAIIEQRLKDTTNAEASANVKILNLLEDVSKLTKENQELLENRWQVVEPADSGRSFATKVFHNSNLPSSKGAYHEENSLSRQQQAISGIGTSGYNSINL